MKTELDLLLEVPGEVPLPEVGPRVVEVLRRLRGADEAEVERLRRWCGLLARRLRGEAALVPADPLQRPTILYLDGFPDHAWHDPARYPVTSVLEEASSMIRSEFLDRTLFPERWPEYREAVAADRKWRACWFYRGGRRLSETAALYPRTSALIDAHSGPDGPLASTLGDCFLSRLESRGRIPAHNGLCNISLVGHLALQIPPGCGIRVGTESRAWEEGRCLVFDDTFEHETWNDSDADRYVLVFVLWQDGVAPIEREFMNLMTRWLNRVTSTYEAR
jgi:aspartate beta-hydroxylase